MKANERDSRTEQERFIDRMLKEILGGQRNPGDRLPTESELAAQYDLRKTNVHLALKELERLGFLEIVPRHATYVAPYWEKANLENTGACIRKLQIFMAARCNSPTVTNPFSSPSMVLSPRELISPPLLFTTM